MLQVNRHIFVYNKYINKYMYHTMSCAKLIIITCCRYDQTAMRQHFMACIERGEMHPFPSQLVKVKRPVKIKRVLRLLSTRRWNGFLPQIQEIVSQELSVYTRCCV